MPDNSGKGRDPMTKGDSSRVQGCQTSGGKDVSSGGFTARARSASDKSPNAGGNAGGEAGKKN